jgi:hypothetical protein
MKTRWRMAYYLLSGTIGLLLPFLGQAPPLPPWPSDNQPPKDLQGKYAFLDQARGFIVLVIPGELEGQPGQQLEIIRVPFHTRFDPLVAVSVEKVSPVAYRYVYSFANGKRAKDPLTSWRIGASCSDSSFRVEAAPDGWHCGVLEHALGISQYALPYLAETVCPVQCFLDGEQPSDSANARVAIVSPAKPGITTASAGEHQNYPVMQLPHALPDAVTEQLLPLGRFEWSERHVVTIGPRFGPGMGLSQIAADFLEGLAELIRTGRLEGDSAFVGQLQSTLVQAAQAGGIETAHLPNPSSEFEREIVTAVKLSMNSDGAAR